MPYDVTFTTTINGTTVATIALNRGIPGSDATVATAIEAAAALGTPIGSENVGVSDAGVLKKWSLTSLKNWVLDGVSSAWDSLTGTATKVPFNTSPSPAPTAVGSVYWNNTYQTLEIVQDADGNTLTVGLETKVPVRNVSGVSITDGLAVYVVGEAASRASVALASVSNSTHIASTIGIASQTIASPGNGKVTTQGEVHNLNTGALTAGQPIYLQENGTYNHTPSAIRIGWVLDSSVGNGKIYVSVARMKWLSADITDATDTPSTGKLIKWPSSGTLPPSTHTHVSSAITDASAPPNADKVALWGDASSASVTAFAVNGITPIDAGDNPQPLVFSADTTFAPGQTVYLAGDINTANNVGYISETSPGNGIWQFNNFTGDSASYTATATAPATNPWDVVAWTVSLGTGQPSFVLNPSIGGYFLPGQRNATKPYLATTANPTGVPSVATANISDLAASRGPVLTGDSTAARAAINAAMASDYKTASFTAAKSGRYHVKGSVTADGSVVVTDPSSPAPATGDVYKVVIVGGYVRIGGSDYFKSRHEITRHYTGSAWETVAPYYSEAPDYAAGVKAAARSNLGSGAVGDAIYTAATVAGALSAVGCITKVAASDASKTTDATTLTSAATDDAELNGYPVEANTTYQFFLKLRHTNTINGGIKFGIYLPSSNQPQSTVIGIMIPAVGAIASSSLLASATAVSQNSITSTVTDLCTVVMGTFTVGATGGNASLRWAQNTSHADTTTRKAGTTLTIRRG